MIVVDASTLLAILFNEPEKQVFEAVITGDERCIMSAFNGHEAACVVRGRLGQAYVGQLWTTLANAEIDVVPFDVVQMRAAAAAFDRYGKGIDPNARLNMADCAAYALATTMNAPLLFKSNDFSQTDVRI